MNTPKTVSVCPECKAMLVNSTYLDMHIAWHIEQRGGLSATFISDPPAGVEEEETESLYNPDDFPEDVHPVYSDAWTPDRTRRPTWFERVASLKEQLARVQRENHNLQHEIERRDYRLRSIQGYVEGMTRD